MVLIRESKTLNTCCYILREIKTGMQRTWTPPHSLSSAQVDEILIMLGSQLERDAQNGICEPFEKSEFDPISLCEIPFQEMTFTQFCDLVFIPKKVTNLAEQTKAQWCSILKRYLCPHFGTQKLSDVRSWQIEEYLTSLQQRGLSYGTVLKHYTILKAFFKVATKREVFHDNPMSCVDRPTARKDEIKENSPISSAYTPKELSYILKCAKNEPLHWRLFIQLLIDTGMRRGEALALTWNNVDFKRKQVTVSASVGYTKSAGTFVTTTKNQKIRVLSLSDECMEMLLIRSIVSGGKYVFPKRGDSNSPMHPNSATYYFRKFGKKYGIDGLHPHSLRHSFASCAIGNGADVASVSEVLGHYDKAFTLRVYTTSNPENRFEAQRLCHNAITHCDL